jgi:hypothetical protein
MFGSLEQASTDTAVTLQSSGAKVDCMKHLDQRKRDTKNIHTTNEQASLLW